MSLKLRAKAKPFNQGHVQGPNDTVPWTQVTPLNKSNVSQLKLQV